VDVLYRCWQGINCSKSAILVDYLLNAVAAGLRLSQQLVINGISTSSRDGVVCAVEQAKGLATAAEAIARLHYYCCGSPGQSQDPFVLHKGDSQSQDAIELYRKKMHQLCSALLKVPSVRR
jgi:hypothetical protein